MSTPNAPESSQLLPVEIVEAIRARRPFRDPQLMGYVSLGGTYMVASPPGVTDHGYRRDLIAVLPGDLGHGRVVPLYLGTNPDVVAFLEEALRG
jgi:hypothetical protein